ncbi:MAG: hemerythrin domain-containing protein [Candidatus Dadabacteria bacterium]
MSHQTTLTKHNEALGHILKEHREGLEFAGKVRKGIKSEVETERMVAYVKWFWKEHLERHFDEEEKWLPKGLPREHPWMKRMFNEHENFRKLMGQVTNKASYEILGQLAQDLEDHIGFEEHLLFHEVEKLAPTEMLHQIAEALNMEEGCSWQWQDRFWVSQ